MKYTLVIFAALFFSSCSDSFINHLLKFEKLGDCSDQVTPIKILSNVAGERYEVISCIDADFDGKNYTVDRKGDSIIVNFPKAGATKAAYKLTLDIDAKPAYRHMILDGREVLLGEKQVLDAQ